ncbi:MAG: outer membrane protein, partial [Deltaproteobacteria bacterium]|nr:outer membrane protein [Deltaproteobacteria bacterium]
MASTMRTPILVMLLVWGAVAFAQTPAPESTSAPTPPPVPAREPTVSPALDPEQPAAPKISVGGYLEVNYQAHFQNPSNRITNLRGFDNRSRTFTLQNVAVDVKGEQGPVAAHVVLQVGHTPSTYYLAEPASPGTGGANASSSELWKYVQAANLTA